MHDQLISSSTNRNDHQIVKLMEISRDSTIISKLGITLARKKYHVYVLMKITDVEYQIQYGLLVQI